MKQRVEETVVEEGGGLDIEEFVSEEEGRHFKDV